MLIVEGAQQTTGSPVHGWIKRGRRSERECARQVVEQQHPRISVGMEQARTVPSRGPDLRGLKVSIDLAADVVVLRPACLHDALARSAAHVQYERVGLAPAEVGDQPGIRHPSGKQ